MAVGAPRWAVHFWGTAAAPQQLPSQRFTAGVRSRMDPCWAHKDEAQGSVCSPESQAHKNEQRRWMLCLPLHDGTSCGATARHTAAPQLTSFLPALLQPHVGLRAQLQTSCSHPPKGTSRNPNPVQEQREAELNSLFTLKHGFKFSVTKSSGATASRGNASGPL